MTSGPGSPIEPVTPDVAPLECIEIIRLSFLERIKLTNYINKFRHLHQSPPLFYNNSISLFSESWSQYLASNNLCISNPLKLYSECITSFNFDRNIMLLLHHAIDMWYSEGKFYNYSKPIFSDKTKDFTSIIWKDSVQYGIGISFNSVTNICYIVLNIYKIGNIKDKFAQNVLPLLKHNIKNEEVGLIEFSLKKDNKTINKNDIIIMLQNIINMLQISNYDKVNMINYVIYFLNVVTLSKDF